MPQGSGRGDHQVTSGPLLNRVVHRSERVTVERYGNPLATLVTPEDLELLEAIENRRDIGAAREALRGPGTV